MAADTISADGRPKAGPAVVVLTAESGTGKTTVCGQVVALARARGLHVAGILTPPRMAGGCKVGLDVEEIATGQRRPLAECAGATDGPATRRWHFHADGLAWGALALSRSAPCDLLVIDEVGPLEIERGQGWTIAFDQLRAGRYRMALVVVRPSLLPRFRQRLGDIETAVLALTEANRDDLPGQIVRELTP